MNRTRVLLAIVIVAAALGGCANQKEPATQAVASITASLDAVRADASKYASEQLTQAEASLASLKASLDKGDYKAVLANAPALTSQIASLEQATAAKKSEAEAAAAAATQEWQGLSADVPQMIAAVQSRVDILSQSKKLPKNLSADALKSAQDGLSSMKSSWAEATSAFSAGNATAAVNKARAVKEQGAKVMQTLGMG
jgi:hypothetical protein